VVVNSLAGKQLHEKIGYRPRRWEVIPNGFDLDRFRPNVVARNRIRQGLGLSSDTVLVALIARLDPMKDHATFIDAATQVIKLRPNTHFLLMGKGVEQLATHAGVKTLSNRVHLFGERQDVDHVLSAVDIACLSSISEGFPNILGEAMAVEVPCVSTDVGDVRFLVGSTGRIVPVRNPEAMAMAIVELIDCSPYVRAELGREARARIEAEFSLPRMIDRYQRLYSDLHGYAP
jgi:glycosyltransferase involved in cell wall biosynthesis